MDRRRNVQLFSAHVKVTTEYSKYDNTKSPHDIKMVLKRQTTRNLYKRKWHQLVQQNILIDKDITYIYNGQLNITSYLL